MSPVLGTVLIASLLGSLHCIAMCGPLVTLVAGEHSLRLAFAHAGGRLAIYATFGALAGLAGGALDLAGELVQVQHVAAILAGVVIIAGGAHAIARARGWIAPRPVGGQLFQRGLVQLRVRRKAATRAVVAGMLTGLVPCGWLWAFVVTAASTGRAGAGALVMVVFWLGTVPAMTGLLVVGGPVLARLRARLPVLTALILVALGVTTLATRWVDAGVTGVAAPHCHHMQSMP